MAAEASLTCKQAVFGWQSSATAAVGHDTLHKPGNVRFVVVAFCWLVLIALCRLYLDGNAALPAELQQNPYDRDATQALLQRIGAHYGGEHVLGFENALISPSKAMDKHCRASIVCMMGMRKFGRCAMMARVGKDAMLMIARLMWNDCVVGAWVVRGWCRTNKPQSKRK